MPKTKNQGKNKSRFEVRGGLLNEYEFALNEGAMTEEERNRFAQSEEERALREDEEGAAEVVPGSPQEREAARIREVMETAHEKAQRNIEKRERREGAAKKGSKTGAAKKGGAGKKGGASKGAQKRGATKKAAKKSAGKKSAKKSGGAGGRGSKGGAKKGSAKKGGGRGSR